MSNWLPTALTAITGGGVALLIGQLVKARNSLRAGARTNTRAIVQDAADARREAEEKLEHQTRLTAFWRALAGNYGYQLRKNGITPDPENPLPPMQAVRADAQARSVVREAEPDVDDDQA